MLTYAEIWIAVLFCVGCKGLTAGNVNLHTVSCLLSADKILTKIHDKCVFYIYMFLGTLGSCGRYSVPRLLGLFY